MSGSAVVIGSAHMDLIARAGRLPRQGESVTGGVFTMAPGGKGGNQAIQLALCRVETTLISRLGDDLFGRELRAALAKKGVRVDRIALDPAAPSGASVVLAAEGDYASIIAPGAANTLSRVDLDAARAEIERADLVVLQWELDPVFVREAVAFCAALGKTILFNASPAPANPASLAGLPRGAIAWLVVNQAEARALADLNVRDAAGASRAAEHLRHTLGVPNVVVTLGGAGSVWCGSGESLVQPAFPVDVVDTVGAGDAFLGALAAGLIQGAGEPEALRRASAAGALAASRAGAYGAFPTAAAIDQFLSAHSET